MVLRRDRRLPRRPRRAVRGRRLPRTGRCARPAEATVGEIPSGWRGELIVDALFGIGLARALDGDYARWVEWANAAATPILALDVPSGLDADTGAAPGPCILAAKTASFIALKPGLLTGDGPDRCGEVVVLDLDLDLPVPAIGGTLLRWVDLARRLPAVLCRQRRNVHKGSFGTLGIVGGATGMVGAPLLAGRAALFAGAGKTLVGFAAEAAPTLDPATPELMLRSADAVLAAALDALVCGPGLATGAKSGELVRRALALPLPLLLDADALNVIADDDALAALAAARGSPTLLTPHPGEAARLLRMTVAAVQRDRPGAAAALAKKLDASVALKGVGTVIAHPDGRYAINGSGNPGLASGGTGDTLSGIRRRAACAGRPRSRGARTRRMPARRGGRRPGRPRDRPPRAHGRGATRRRARAAQRRRTNAAGRPGLGDRSGPSNRAAPWRPALLDPASRRSSTR